MILVSVLIILLGCQSGSCETPIQPETETEQRTVEPPSEDTNLSDVAPLFITLDSPTSLDIVVDKPNLLIEGTTRLDALLTVGEDAVEPDVNGKFRHEIVLSPGHNVVEILASTSQGDQQSMILAVIYAP